MIKCCYQCPDRWAKDGMTCHGVCQKYADAVAEDTRRKEVIQQAKSGDIAMIQYTKTKYRARDRQASRDEIRGRKKW